jgi:hypothetical protein
VKATNALDIDFPATLLARANDVTEYRSWVALQTFAAHESGSSGNFMLAGSP